MKKVIMIISVAAILVGCKGKGTRVQISDSVDKFNVEKIVALDKLMDIAKCYNGDWKPDWNSNEHKYNIMRTREYGITSCSSYNEGAIYFKNKEDAQAVIDNPNFRSILDAIYKD